MIFPDVPLLFPVKTHLLTFSPMDFGTSLSSCSIYEALTAVAGLRDATEFTIEHAGKLGFDHDK